MLLRITCSLALLLLSSTCTAASAADRDGDGIPDDLEQAILDRFLPAFHLAAADCDVAPAEFQPGTATPAVRSKNGTIYGQVFPVSGASGHDSLEVHYYHLWAQDCGQPPHLLDAESVSGLLRGSLAEDRAGAWQAVLWYAAAHENTLCDMSNAARATALGATEKGPDVWISADKHASFLDRELCLKGCGKDRCDTTQALRPPLIINLGEPGRLLGPFDWVRSPAWPLADKMQPDFTEAVLARMPDGDGVQLVPARNVTRGVRNTIRVAGTTWSALGTSNDYTASGVATGLDGGASGISVAAKQSGKALGRALKATTRALGRAVGQLPGER